MAIVSFPSISALGHRSHKHPHEGEDVEPPRPNHAMAPCGFSEPPRNSPRRSLEPRSSNSAMPR
jgi:hypothetical protein